MSVRRRCLKFASSWKWKSALHCKLRSDRWTLDVSTSLPRNHIFSHLEEKERLKRVKAVCSSIFFSLYSDYKGKMVPKVTIQKQSAHTYTIVDHKEWKNFSSALGACKSMIAPENNAIASAIGGQAEDARTCKTGKNYRDDRV